MGRSIRRGLVGLLVLCASLLSGGAPAVARDSTSFSAPGMSPRTDGQTVVWQAENPGNSFDIYAMPVGATSGTIIAGGPLDQFTPDVSGDRVVWVEGDPLTNAFDIQGINLSTMSTFTVAATDASETAPSISGNWVVWVSSGPDAATGNWMSSLLARDLTTNDAPLVLDTVPYNTSTGSPGIFRPAISGDNVAWIEATQETTHSVHWKLMTRHLSDTDATQIAEGYYDNAGPGAYTGPLQRPGYDLDGDRLVYSANYNVYLVDLIRGQSTRLAGIANPGWLPGQNPTIDGRYIFWQDYRYTGDALGLSNIARGGLIRTDLIGFDLSTGAEVEFPVTTDTGANTNPQMRGGELVYTRTDPAHPEAPEIHAVPVAQVLPTAPEPDPGTTNPNWLYFPPTGQYLAFGFKDFWTASGGLPVFGYPITGEFSEGDRTVQFTERQRFEYHPEFAGTPYETELGRLGFERAQEDLFNLTAPFQPLPSGTTSDANCTFFAETGHRLCAGFKAYWQSHGLEFGDAGISYRESLALFGYPLSEEFVEPGTGLTVQYFERAVFEYHPGNAEPYKILLTRLGAYDIAERGW